jgi:hypothetical protein
MQFAEVVPCRARQGTTSNTKIQMQVKFRNAIAEIGGFGRMA